MIESVSYSLSALAGILTLEVTSSEVLEKVNSLVSNLLNLFPALVVMLTKPKAAKKFDEVTTLVSFVEASRFTARE
jgi:hypothetical protein